MAEQAPSPEDKANGPAGIHPALGPVLLPPAPVDLSQREVFGARAALTVRVDHCRATAGAVPQQFVLGRGRAGDVRQRELVLGRTPGRSGQKRGEGSCLKLSRDR